MLKTGKSMSQNENGFSVVELLVTMLVGALFLFAFYQIYAATQRMSQDSLEEAYAVNMAARYIDEARYSAATKTKDFDSADEASVPYATQPGARGEYRLRAVATDETSTLKNYETIVDFGPSSNRKLVVLKAFVRYDGGLYYQ